jgi:hypothetical protein
MGTSRKRVIDAINFLPTDRLPKDLAGMCSTGISAFAYPKLVAALGFPLAGQGFMTRDRCLLCPISMY